MWLFSAGLSAVVRLFRKLYGDPWVYAEIGVISVIESNGSVCWGLLVYLLARKRQHAESRRVRATSVPGRSELHAW